MKKLLGLLGSIGIITSSVISVVSCVDKTPANISNLTKDDVNQTIWNIIDMKQLNATIDSYGSPEIYSWIQKSRSLGGSRPSTSDTTWLSVKMTSVFLDELLTRIPNLYKSFPHFALLVDSYIVSENTIGKEPGTNGEGTPRINYDFLVGSAPDSKEQIGIRVQVGWTFDNANSNEFIETMINNKLQHSNINKGGQTVQDKDGNWIKIPYTYETIRNEMEFYSLFQSPYYEPDWFFEYFVDNRANAVWSSNPNFTPYPKETYRSANFAINFTFNQINDRQKKLQNFINDLTKVKTFVYDGLNFNELFNEYFFNLNISVVNPKNLTLNLSDYPKQDYLKILYDDANEFNKYKINTINDYKKRLIPNFSFDDIAFNNKRLFDDLKIDFKPKKYLAPKDFDKKTQQGKINRIIFGNDTSSKDDANPTWNSEQSGLLIIEVIVDFIQKDELGNELFSIPYSFHLPVYAQYI